MKPLLFQGFEFSWKVAHLPYCPSDRDGTHALLLRVLWLQQTKGNTHTRYTEYVIKIYQYVVNVHITVTVYSPNIHTNYNLILWKCRP